MPIRTLFGSTLPAARRTVALGLALAIGLGPFAAPALAQDTTPPATTSQPAQAQMQAPSSAQAAVVPTRQDYSKPRSHFINPVAPYIGRDVPEPSFANTARIDQLMRNGTLYLSMNDVIALALENNLDLAIARYNLSIADTDILRASSGGSTRGVASGLVQGTPGGGVGGFGTGASGAGAGGTTSGAGGAGTGTGGLVSSTLGTGTVIDSLDPILSSSLSLGHLTFTTPNTVTTGIPNVQQNTGTVNFNYFQGWSTGTALNVGFNNGRNVTNSPFTTINPNLTSSFRMTLRQHLLAGFGTAANRRFIRIAKNNREISDIGFRNQVSTTVSQIQNIYWDLVNAYEDVKVKQRSLDLANKTLSDNKKQVEIGTLAPIEITRAQSEASTREQDLIVSQTNLQLQQLLMKNAISRSLTDPQLATAPVVPTDTMAISDQEPVVPTQDLINDALGHRPELAQARIDLTNRDITKKSARNALLPTADLSAWYGGSGLAGDQNPLSPCGAPAPPCVQRTGYPQAFSNLFTGNLPDYGVGMSFSIPIRNRAAQADQVRSELEYRQAQMRLQQLQNQVSIEVRNAQYALQQNRARVEAAQKARDLAQQSLDAEQKKYALGASTNTLVLQAQRDLAQASSNVVLSTTAYEKSRVELDRVTGLTLDHNNISLADSEVGIVTKMPSAPGVTPRTDLTPDQQQPQQ
ncbi:MAG: TolC family protein [Candidatus Koribacter versatilis]|uniref:TolC family protein n=1 Tax=Candidatus Korobacter versatilis TaxID=658062 RepID=A0A932A6U0_9BACT|nr:TolC family protein [Candidatus Koribacter versatilis]